MASPQWKCKANVAENECRKAAENTLSAAGGGLFKCELGRLTVLRRLRSSVVYAAERTNATPVAASKQAGLSAYLPPPYLVPHFRKNFECANRNGRPIEKLQSTGSPRHEVGGGQMPLEIVRVIDPSVYFGVASFGILVFNGGGTTINPQASCGELVSALLG